MPVKAYVGTFGSGKTFEVASVVILEALRQGRRVVSNIAGLNLDEYEKLLTSQGLPADKIGSIVSIPHDDVMNEFFFRTDYDHEKGTETFIQPGDLVVLDEVWRFWDGFTRPPERFMNFYRMHRQLSHPVTGLTCEIVFISQEVTDIWSKVRGKIEQTYRMEKATAIGSTKRYRVDIFTGGTVRGAPLRQLFKEYNPVYFGLYKSHSGHQEGSAAPEEKTIDSRGNILKGVIFKVVLPLALLFGAVGVYFVWGFFHPENKKLPSSSVNSVSSSPVSATVQPVRSASVSENWRIYGWYSGPSGMVAILQDNDGRLRHEYMPSNMRIYGLSASLTLDEDRVTKYSGTVRQSRSDPAEVVP